MNIYSEPRYLFQIDSYITSRINLIYHIKCIYRMFE